MWSVKLAGAFSAYDRDVSAKIEESFQEDSSGECRLVLRGNDYTIDFAAMKQRQTSDSSKVRAVKRSATPRTAALVPAPGAPVPVPATAPAPAPDVPTSAAKTEDDRCCNERESRKRPIAVEDLAASSSAAAPPRAPAAAPAATTAAPPAARRQLRPHGPSFLGGTDRSAGPADARSTIDTSRLSVETADDVFVFRGTGVGNEALRQVIQLAGNNLPAPDEHIPGRAPSQKRVDSSRSYCRFLKVCS